MRCIASIRRGYQDEGEVRDRRDREGWIWFAQHSLSHAHTVFGFLLPSFLAGFDE